MAKKKAPRGTSFTGKRRHDIVTAAKGKRTSSSHAVAVDATMYLVIGEMIDGDMRVFVQGLELAKKEANKLIADGAQAAYVVPVVYYAEMKKAKHIDHIS
jgi:hypothetical protein